MKLEIHPAIATDKPAVMRILNNTPEFLPFEVDVAEELLDCYLGDPVKSGYYVLVAEAESRVVGYICYGPTPVTQGTWDIYWVATDRDYRGKGVGTALFETVEAKIREARGRLVIIETSGKPDYENTRRFYSRRDYKEACRIADFYAPGDDKLTLVKRFS